jgi:hypothetical protein
MTGGSLVQDHRGWINVSWVLLARVLLGAGMDLPKVDSAGIPAGPPEENGMFAFHLDFAESSPCMSGGGRNRERNG